MVGNITVGIVVLLILCGMLLPVFFEYLLIFFVFNVVIKLSTAYHSPFYTYKAFQRDFVLLSLYLQALFL